MQEVYKNLLNDAKKVSANSYSPYSNFPVGAAVLYESGLIYTGCNIENVSFGLSLCAERSAIANAITKGEKTRIKAIAIYCPKQTLCFPCGACRQWLSEFCIDDKETKIVLEDKNREIKVFELGDIFPLGFKMKNDFLMSE